MRAGPMGIGRPVTRSGLFLEHMICTTLVTVGWTLYSCIVGAIENVADGWKLIPYVYFWLSPPLLFILVIGWLLRQKCHAAIARALEMAAKIWRLPLPSWVVVSAVLGAVTASMVDVLFVWAEDLDRSSDWHWLLLPWGVAGRSEEHTSELQSLRHLVCRLLLEKKKKKKKPKKLQKQTTTD